MNNKFIVNLVQALLFVLFVFTFGVAFFPTLDADHAIQVIMIDHLSFPADLYYMGQDRIGSIIPGIAWPFYQIGFSALMATTIAQIIILGISANVLSKLFHQPVLAISASIVLLFPLSEFESQVLSGHPYLGHLLILFLGIYTLKKYGLQNPVVFLFVGLGMWASGIFAANIAAAGLLYLISGQIKLKDKSFWVSTLKGILWSIPGLALWYVAKATATTTDDSYTQSSFVDYNGLIENITVFAEHIYVFLDFQDPDQYMSWALWVLIVLALVSVPALLKKRLVSYSWFFILSGGITVLAILLSEWAHRMGLPIRYFSIAYIQILWGLLLAWDSNTAFVRIRKGILVLALINSLLVMASGLLTQDIFWRQVPGRLYASTAKELASKIETKGILGSYWYVYLIEAFKPEAIESLVREGEINRDFSAMKKFLEIDTVTIIRNSFVNELTPKIYDRGVWYQKIEPTQKVDFVEYAKYIRESNFLPIYKADQLISRYGEVVVDSLGEKLFRFTPENFEGNNWAVFGPYLTLGAGKYEACFNIETMGDIGMETFVDVQKRPNYIKRVSLKEVGDNPCIEFELTETASDVEFRLGYYGMGQVDFKSVELRKIDP